MSPNFCRYSKSDETVQSCKNSLEPFNELTDLLQESQYFNNKHIKHYNTSNVTDRHRALKRKLRAGYRAPSLHPHSICCKSYFCLLNIPSLSNTRRIFQCQMRYCVVSLRYACNQHSGIILTPLGYPTLVPNFVSIMPSIAELAHGEKLRTQSLTQSLNHSLTQII